MDMELINGMREAYNVGDNKTNECFTHRQRRGLENNERQKSGHGRDRH